MFYLTYIIYEKTKFNIIKNIMKIKTIKKLIKLITKN